MGKLSGKLMLKNEEIAVIKDGTIVWAEEERLPYFLCRTGDVAEWLRLRLASRRRPHLQLVKKELGWEDVSDMDLILQLYGVCLTDAYWFLPEGEEKSWKDVACLDDRYASLALTGQQGFFSSLPQEASREDETPGFHTPELTNVGSYEKCWKKDSEGIWWLYKEGTDEEYFSELFISILARKLGFPAAYYEMERGYIRTKNFIRENQFLTHFFNMNGEDNDYLVCFSFIYQLLRPFAKQYLQMIWLDTIVCNLDRHTANFAFLRSLDTGTIVAMAPNYDNNIALISRGYPSDSSRKEDVMMTLFENFIQESPLARSLYQQMNLPVLTRELIEECLDETGFDVDREFIIQFLLNGYHRTEKILSQKDGS